MTDLSAADAARLADIRRDYVGCNDTATGSSPAFLLRLLVAKPEGEFVTRQKYLDEVALSGKLSGLVTELNNALIAAEAERDRLAAALATAQARIEEARAHLGAAVAQLIPSDDRIIGDHVRDAYDALAGKRP